MQPIPQTEPRSITQGETLLFQRVLSASAPPSWSLNYVLVGPAVITIAGGNNGTAHEVNVNSATTANWQPGDYSVFARISDGTSIFAVTPTYQTIAVLPNPANVDVPATDQRSWARRTLEAAEKALLQLASKTVSMATVDGTTYTMRDLDQLAKLRGQLRVEVANEDAFANPSGRLVYTRFTQPW